MTPQIVKLCIEPAAQQAVAIITDHEGHRLGLWNVIDGPFKQHFQDRDSAYFYADLEDEDGIDLLAPAPDQEW
jgi:hypothetical protein